MSVREDVGSRRWREQVLVRTLGFEDGWILRPISIEERNEC